MAKALKRIVSTGLWDDDLIISDFTPEDKYFMLYLLTNRYTTQLGIYHLPIKYAAMDMGYSVDSLNNLLDRFENKYGIIKFSKETSEIAIKNYLRHSIMKGGKPVYDCLIKDEKSIKDKSLLLFLYKHIVNYISEIDIPTVINYINHLKEIINNNNNDNDNDNERNVDVTWTLRSDESEEEPKWASEVKEIIDYLNQRADTHYSYKNESYNKHIRARLNEGHTVEEFKTVIDKKCLTWLTDSKMSQYVRPQTLFSTNFESYLNEKNVVSKPQSSIAGWLEAGRRVSEGDF